MRTFTKSSCSTPIAMQSAAIVPNVVGRSGPGPVESLRSKRNTARFGCRNVVLRHWHCASLPEMSEYLLYENHASNLCVLILLAQHPAVASPTDVEGTWLSGDGDGLIAVRVAVSQIQRYNSGLAQRRARPAENRRQEPGPGAARACARRPRDIQRLSLRRRRRMVRWIDLRPQQRQDLQLQTKTVDRDTLNVRGFHWYLADRAHRDLDVARPTSPPIIASASISTSMSGSISCDTSTMVVAGRISAKASPWARPMASHWLISVTKMRVRTTSLKSASASFSAFSMIQCSVSPGRKRPRRQQPRHRRQPVRFRSRRHAAQPGPHGSSRQSIPRARR